ncbi:HDOD domain-containing protein [Pseudomonas sp. GD03944]|uniref:HDOD domain-containing protein n=1 Tax=Pseudomonas sp. GD03944 TaxID=2975409 RepID=UPI002447942D|nr:HDOD domain-containing protein [Pseudomonas sp. GD03944]MDH1262522.1 response regulator [Pseudomonas sp. GD03944]
MSTSSQSPVVLIADEDPWTRDLLQQLVRTARCDARIRGVSDGSSALDQCQRERPALVIADWALPGVDGLELLRQLRRNRQAPVPFFLLSSKADANSVKAALQLAPTAYLTKPFDAEKLLQRLRQVLILPGEEVVCPIPALAQGESLDAFLDRCRDSAQGAPMLESVQEAVQRLSSNNCDLGQLERLFGVDPQLTAQLIAAANSADRQRGAACQSLAQALPKLGLVHALNLALGVAMQRSANLQHDVLATSAAHYWALSQRTADHARWLAVRLRANADRCYTAGLLHCLGDLAVLRTLNDWHEAGGELSELQIVGALRAHSASYGAALRTRWRLPLEMRELIGAAWKLGSGVFSREALIMNVAAQLAHLPAEAPTDEVLESKAARMLGIQKALFAELPRAETPT